ncbi:MAG: hypothetical protein QM627_00385 [Luteolibacter sp.]
MKRILLLLALLAPEAFGQASAYTSFIRQIQDGVTWDSSALIPSSNTSTSSSSGSTTSRTAISEKGSVFQLWTIHNTTGSSHLLDQKAVGAYLPKGTLTITTNDPTGEKWGVKRTRIDQPFTVTATVSNLLAPGTGIPDAATKVLFQQHLGLYADHNPNLDAATVLATDPIASAYITANKILTPDKSSLYAVNPTGTSGEEHFVLRLLPDGTLPQTQIASDKIQIWPLATATVTGLGEDPIIKGVAPPLSITYTNLYPSSSTRIIAYPVSDRSKAIQLPKSEITVDAKTPTSITFTVSGYDAALPSDGVYNIDVVTTTPFKTDETLSSTSVTVNKTLRVRAMQVGASSD